MPDERVPTVDERLQARVRLGADLDVEDACGIELSVLALGDPPECVELPGVGIDHEEAVIGQLATKLVGIMGGRRPYERLAWCGGDLEDHDGCSGARRRRLTKILRTMVVTVNAAVIVVPDDDSAPLWSVPIPTMKLAKILATK